MGMRQGELFADTLWQYKIYPSPRSIKRKTRDFMATEKTPIKKSLFISKRSAWTLLFSGLIATAPGAAGASQGDDPGCRGCLQSASGLFARGDNEGAARLLAQWQARCPNNLQLLLMLNTVLMRTADGKKRALEAADQACALAPTSMLAHFQKAMTLMTLQQGPAAAREFQIVVELDPTSYESWLALSDLLGAQGDAKGAKNATDHAAALSPSAKQSQLSGLVSKDRAGNIAGLKQELAKIADNPATTPETLLIIGEELIKLGYFAEAAQTLSQAAESYPQSPQVKQLLPYALFEAGKLDELSKPVAAQKKGADKSTAGSTEAMTALCKLAQGQYQAGQKMLENASPASTSDALFYLAKGSEAMAAGLYKEAIEKFSDAQTKNKSLNAVKIYTAMAYLELGDLKEAIAQARDSQQKAGGLKVRAASIELLARLRDGEDNGTSLPTLKSELTTLAPLLSIKDQAMAESALGELALKEKDPGRAKEKFNDAIGHMPGLVRARVGLAQVALLEGDSKAALQDLDQALAEAPGNIDALAFKALALIDCADFINAEGALTQAQSEGQLPAPICLSLGKAYRKAGQSKPAAQYFKLALQNGLIGSALTQASDGLKSLGESAGAKK